MARTRTIVHCGPPGFERNERLFRQMLEEFDPLEVRTLYLVAGRFRRGQLTKVFLRAFPAVFETPILTLDELTRTLLRAEPMPAHRIDETEKRGLIEEILGSGRYRLGDAVFRAGALPHVSRYVAFVKEQNIFDAQMLRLRYRKFRRSPSPLELELIQVFADYQSILLERGLEDREGERARLYTGLLTGSLDPGRVFPDLRKIVLEGFYRLTLLEAGILNLLGQGLREWEVSVGGLETPEWDLRRPEWRFLEVADPEWVVHAAPSALPRRRFVRPAGRPEEVLFAAREIARLKAEDPGLPFSSIAVVCNRPAAYWASLDEIFKEFGIPFSTVSGRPAGQSAAVASLIKYLRVLADDFAGEPLLDFLRDAHVKLPNCPAEDLTALAALAPTESRGVDFWRSEFPEWVRLRVPEIGRRKPRLARRLEVAAAALAEAVASLALPLDAKRPLSRWRHEVAARLSPYWFLPEADGAGRAGENLRWTDFWLDLAAASLTRRPGEACSFDQFRALVEGLSGTARSRPDDQREAVAVGSPAAFQQARFRHLFWLGLAEGEYPENPTQHIFFDDVRSSQWGFFGWEERLDESRWLFRSLTASVRDGLYLSCPLRIGDAATLPSSLIRDLALTETEVAPAPEEFAVLGFVLDEKARRNVRRGHRALRFREDRDETAFQGIFEDGERLGQLRQSSFPKSVTVSPSQLEEYVRCGFRYFLRKVLRVVPIEGAAGAVTPLERGNLVHKVVFRFMTEDFQPPPDFSESTRDVWLGRERRRMHRILLSELEALRPETRWRETLFGKHEERRLASGLLDDESPGVMAEFIDQQWERLKEFRVEALEMEIGPLELGTVADSEAGRLKPVRLRGKIDRLDSGPAGLFLIDYKTGLPQHLRVYDGWGFQLPLYVWMAGKWLGRPVAGAGFYTLRPPLEVRLRELLAKDGGDPERGLRRLADYYRTKALEAVRNLHAGRFPVTLLGRDKAGCGSCDFRRVCRFEGAHAERLRRRGRFPVDERIIERGAWIEERT